ncbi:cardiolipin synthase A, partial [Clavibacter lycopersici]
MDPSMTTLVLAGLAVVVDFVVRITALLVIPRNRRPSTAMAWLMAIFFLPYLGILLFLLIGSTRLPKRRREKQQEINRFIIESTEGIERVTREHSWPSWLDSVVELNRTLGSMPLVGGNRAKLYSHYDESIAAMTAEVEKATRYVHVEFYIL